LTAPLVVQHHVRMRAITYSYARANLATTMDRVRDDCDPVIITRRGEEAYVLMTLADYERLDETAYLLRSPANAERLMRSIEQANAGLARERPIDLDS
jgi:antitoxin YefM